jgi:hypothetical protein
MLDSRADQRRERWQANDCSSPCARNIPQLIKESIVSTNVWNLMYRMGTVGKVISSADNPLTRKVALDGAAVVTKNGWRVWVEHHASGKIIYRNFAEVEYQQSLVAKQIIEFAEANGITGRPVKIGFRTAMENEQINHNAVRSAHLPGSRNN